MIRTWFINLWDAFRTSFWFVPALMTLAALGLAVIVPQLDALAGSFVPDQLPWLSSTSASARAALGAIASAMVTVAGVVFSITVVGLSMTSSQYGPRLLRTFMSNTSTQIALGTFIATSLYSLLVLREIRGGPEDERFVPHLSVSLGVVLAVVSIGVLIYFIHGVSMSVQAPQVIKSVAAELDDAIKRLFPDAIGEERRGDEHDEVERRVAALGDDFYICRARKEGYLQAVDTDGLLQLAEESEFTCRLLCRPGQFLVEGCELAHTWPYSKGAPEVEESLNELLIVGSRRTPRQDVECAITEMVEVAVRALSPGVNDPFTAINCVDRLTASLSRLAQRSIPSPLRVNDEGVLRVIAPVVSFDDVLNTAFSQIRRHGEGNVAVTVALLSGLHQIAQSTVSHEDLDVVIKHVNSVRRGAERSIEDPEDLDIIHALSAKACSLYENSDTHQHFKPMPVEHT